MGSIRRGFQQWVRRLEPALVLVSAVVLVGFGTHAALDWHHHGSPAAGFFHLHAHAGIHHHDQAVDHDARGHHHFEHRHDHPHPGPGHHESGPPEPDSSSDRRDDTFTIAFGVGPAPALAAVEAPSADPDGRQDPWSPVLIANELTDQPWIPRGPPV